ncbi:hypothetical protein PVK06_007545 [Gossypium arboreum]|uniref:Uncharacterized protein n=1 Tax=Gossypium arboreum TaxID=29729 RepID=A0ABR0QIE0_GOSAR|nr:hypothetical protein PVK06_007545 [Gossypium arboreum]
MLLIPFLLLLSLLLIFIKTLTAKKGKLPPGPPKLPILGNLHQLGPFPHRSTWQLSKKHGPIMLLQLGSTPPLVVSSAESAKEVLKIHDLECCSRPPLTGPKRLTYNFQDVAFAPYGHYWKEMRKICVAELFSMKSFSRFNLLGKKSIIFRIVFGKQFQGSELDNDKLQKVVFEAEAMLGSFCASDFLPLESSFHELDSVFQRVIKDHLDSGPTKDDEEDIVDVLLRMEKDQTQNDAIQLTKDQIKAG